MSDTDLDARQMSYESRMSPLSDFQDVITPDDNNDLPAPIRSIRVHGADGNIKVRTAGGVDRVFHNIVVGEYTSPVMITKVYATGTTATGLEGY